MGVHGAGEILALLMADRRVKFRSDLISWRWLPSSATCVTCFLLAEAVNWQSLLV